MNHHGINTTTKVPNALPSLGCSHRVLPPCLLLKFLSFSSAFALSRVSPLNGSDFPVNQLNIGSESYVGISTFLRLRARIYSKIQHHELVLTHTTHQRSDSDRAIMAVTSSSSSMQIINSKSPPSIAAN